MYSRRINLLVLLNILWLKHCSKISFNSGIGWKLEYDKGLWPFLIETSISSKGSKWLSSCHGFNPENNSKIKHPINQEA